MMPFSRVTKLPRTATSLVADLEVDPERLQDAAADAVFERVVPEEAQVPGPAARRDARQDRQAQTADALAQAQASRLGVRAVSSSVFPPGCSGSPPSPSATSRTIFESLVSRSSATSSWMFMPGVYAGWKS